MVKQLCSCGYKLLNFNLYVNEICCDKIIVMCTRFSFGYFFYLIIINGM